MVDKRTPSSTNSQQRFDAGSLAFCPFRPDCLPWTSPSFSPRNPFLAYFHIFLVPSRVRSTQIGRVRTMPMHPMSPASNINNGCHATDQLERLHSRESRSSATTCSGPESMRQTYMIHNYCEELRRYCRWIRIFMPKSRQVQVQSPLIDVSRSP